MHAHPSAIDRFPGSLFFDDDIIWHRQHFGMPGHVAFACLVVTDGNVYGLSYQSDLVQRISRRRDLKTRVENVFMGWYYLLLNSVLSFAVENHLARIYSNQHQDQLYRCRLVDRRVRGFRTPQSVTTAEWSDDNLVFRNFDWCATSACTVGAERPVLRNGLVTIPVHFDEFSLYKAHTSFDDWERSALKTIERSDFVVFGLHDCYADLWLAHYPAFLKRIANLGTFKTLDQIADDTILGHAA